MPPWSRMVGMRKGCRYSPGTRSFGTFNIIIAKVVRMLFLVNDSGRRGRCRGREWACVCIMDLHFNHLCRDRVVFVSSLIPLECHDWAPKPKVLQSAVIQEKINMWFGLVNQGSKAKMQGFRHRTSMNCSRFRFGVSDSGEIGTVQRIYIRRTHDVIS